MAANLQKIPLAVTQELIANNVSSQWITAGAMQYGTHLWLGGRGNNMTSENRTEKGGDEKKDKPHLSSISCTVGVLQG